MPSKRLDLRPLVASYDVNRYYPFSAAVVNICFELSGWLMLDARRPPANAETVCSGRGYRRFANFLEVEPDAFFLITTAAVASMHEDWKENSRSILDFGISIRSAMTRTAAFLNDPPEGPPIQVLDELRTSWTLKK
ncbi:unnamed protein product [Polarella glacialis]|uniref:Uncharacterized protein n=1 Tax=Polarella glacialis TaxID=89957 RepID=A0A813FXD5_POLGL|nr:unnamed protein product [Polarella glacialis]